MKCKLRKPVEWDQEATIKLRREQAKKKPFVADRSFTYIFSNEERKSFVNCWAIKLFNGNLEKVMNDCGGKVLPASVFGKYPIFVELPLELYELIKYGGRLEVLCPSGGFVIEY